MLFERFPRLGDMRVLDLGGTPWSWEYAPARPQRIVTLNLEPLPGPDWVESMVGDACAPPPEVEGQEFDFVYSNSVIEHVGGHWRRSGFADVVRRVAPHHWIQTPARSFPLEPHWLFPGFQYLPVGARAAIAKRWRFGHMGADATSEQDGVASVLSVELVSVPEMRLLFPDSELVRERVIGLTKSLVAVR
jgi:hypothetical protein